LSLFLASLLGRCFGEVFDIDWRKRKVGATRLEKKRAIQVVDQLALLLRIS